MIHKKDEKNPIVICDYGTADGGVSLQLMRDLLGSYLEICSTAFSVYFITYLLLMIILISYEKSY